MPKSIIDMSKFIFKKDELLVALKVQKILQDIDTDAHIAEDDLLLPAARSLKLTGQFHKKLYDNVLKPYSDRVKDGYFYAFFAAYSHADFKRLMAYQSFFYKVLNIIAEDLSPLRRVADSNYDLQLNIINICLFSALVDMATTLPWHKEARSLWEVMTRNSNLGYNLEPLVIVEDEKVQVDSLHGRLLFALNRAEMAETTLGECRKEVARARTEAAEARAEAAEARAEASEAKAAAVESAAQATKSHEAVVRLEKSIEKYGLVPKTQPERAPSSASKFLGFFRKTSTSENTVLQENRGLRN